MIIVIIRPICKDYTMLSQKQIDHLSTRMVESSNIPIQQYPLRMPSFFQHLSWAPLRWSMKLFCSFKIVGIENLTSSKRGVIIASNHISELDPMLISCCLPYFSSHLPLYYVSRVKDFYKNNRLSFLYGGEFFRLMGAYPAYSGLKDYKQALNHHLALLNQNKDVVIFPMGKKYTQNDPTKARGGVAFLAKETKSPIVPVLIQGIENFSFTAFLSGKQKLTITFGKPINSDEIFITNENTTINNGRNEYEKAASILMEKIFQLAKVK